MDPMTSPERPRAAVTELRRSPRKAASSTANPDSRSRISKSTSPKKSAKGRLAFSDRLLLEYEQLREYNVRPPRQPPGYWPYPHLPGVKFGHNPWVHVNFRGPSLEQVSLVHRLLVDYHRQFKIQSFVGVPAHATNGSLTADVVIQTMFAQATGNESAINAHSRLCYTCTFLVDGKKVLGRTPDWHAVCNLSEAQLQDALQAQGMHKVRASRVRCFLLFVKATNMERQRLGLQEYEHEANAPDSAEFVPGLLSLDFLLEGDNSTEALFGRLTKIDGIGTKSAMCILAFALHRPLFVVDTHVLRICKWLGWLPEECSDMHKAAMFLHNKIPDGIKFDLHNQMWTHCANENTREAADRALLCGVCGANPPSKDKDVQKYLDRCPLTPHLPPVEERWPSRRSSDSLAEEAVRSLSTAPRTPKREQRTMDAFFTPTKPSSIKLASPSRVLHTPNRIYKTLNHLLKRRTIKFEDVDPQHHNKLNDEGYLLWTFRPLDNSFMQKQGTFEKKPRFVFERPTVMDSDVADYGSCERRSSWPDQDDLQHCHSQRHRNGESGQVGRYWD